MQVTNMKNDLKKCLIISGGKYYRPSFITGFAGFVIACDLGLDHTIKMGLVPNIVIGDFDSVSDYGKNMIDERKIECIKHPPIKDDTDTALAVKYALSQGYKDIIIICAFGGRTDHFLGNITAARYGAECGALIRIEDEDTKITVFSECSISLNRIEGFSLSVFSLTDECRGVSIKGAKYKLENAVLKGDLTLGVSNEFVDDTVIVSVDAGALMCVMSRL